MRNKKYLFLVTIAVVALLSIGVLATVNDYTITLPALQGHITCTSAYKVSSETYLLHKVTNLGGGYDSIISWCDTTTQVTDRYSIYEGQGFTTLAYSNTPPPIGTYLKARAHNRTFSIYNVTCSGTVDFK